MKFLNYIVLSDHGKHGWNQLSATCKKKKHIAKLCHFWPRTLWLQFHQGAIEHTFLAVPRYPKAQAQPAPWQSVTEIHRIDVVVTKWWNMMEKWWKEWWNVMKSWSSQSKCVNWYQVWSTGSFPSKTGWFPQKSNWKSTLDVYSKSDKKTINYVLSCYSYSHNLSNWGNE